MNRTNYFPLALVTGWCAMLVPWAGPAMAVQGNVPEVVISEATYADRPHFVITTHRATYWLDKQSGGLSRLIDRAGNDWIGFKMEPWGKYPQSAASSYRGIPNLIHGGDEGGFGHPGWDTAASEQTDDDTIVTTSHSGKWQLRWDFSATRATATVTKVDGDQPYWFLYEGTVGGRWAPDQQYFATDTSGPRHRPHDFFRGDRIYETWRWAYFGDDSLARVLYVLQHQPDDQLDTFSHLGNSDQGLRSEDGMVVFGFGRGKAGIQPLLRGKQAFTIGLLEGDGSSERGYESLKKAISKQAP